MKGRTGGCVKGFQEREKVRWGRRDKNGLCVRERKTGRDREKKKESRCVNKHDCVETIFIAG